jgi:hypothetical protein
MTRATAVWLICFGMWPCLTDSEKLPLLIAKIKAVRAEGADNAAVGMAWKDLVRQGPDALPAILAALDDASPIATNWLRGAFDAIAERELRAHRPLPVNQMEDFLKDTHHAGKARRLAFDWLTQLDLKTPERLLPGMLQDPSVELRRDAVAMVLRQARQFDERMDIANAIAAYRKALEGARDRDQVDLIVKQLKALGVEVDVAAHFNFVRRWQLVGPFDNSGGVGFAAQLPPEKGVDLAASYKGKQNAPLKWTEHSTADPYGQVDLNKAVGKHMGATAYAFAVVESPLEQKVEIRLASNNSVKIFLNGREIFAHEEYHHGVYMDQYVGTGVLNKGRSELLIKICQNEQTDVWAQSWGFQGRVCDAVGSAVPMTIASEKSAAQAEGKVGQ